METYNCEPTTHPKPEAYGWRAKKQLYRPQFVLNHFVHYSVVTRRILDEPMKESLRFVEKAPFERRVNEVTEVREYFVLCLRYHPSLLLPDTFYCRASFFIARRHLRIRL
jgi:hypothetical protein